MLIFVSCRSAYFLFAKMLAVRVDPLLPPQPTNMTLRKVADVQCCTGRVIIRQHLCGRTASLPQLW